MATQYEGPLTSAVNVDGVVFLLTANAGLTYDAFGEYADGLESVLLSLPHHEVERIRDELLIMKMSGRPVAINTILSAALLRTLSASQVSIEAVDDLLYVS